MSAWALLRYFIAGLLAAIISSHLNFEFWEFCVLMVFLIFLIDDKSSSYDIQIEFIKKRLNEILLLVHK